MDEKIDIRPARVEDIPEMVRIYDAAREFMRRAGNPNQWRSDYPSAETALRDIEAGGSYVCEAGGRIVATFFFTVGDEPTYAQIDGAWLDDAPYGVIHRVASDGTVRGLMRRILDHCRALHPVLRIDTHADNLPMQRVLLAYGFRPCGTIHLLTGAPRLAFHLPRQPLPR